MQNVPQRLAFLGHNTMQRINLLEQECEKVSHFCPQCLVLAMFGEASAARRNSLSHFTAKGGKTEGQRATVTIQAQHNSLEMGIFQVFTYNMGIQFPYSPTIPLRKYLAQHLKTHISLAANVLQGFRESEMAIAWHLETWNQAIEPLNPRVGYRTSLWSWLGFDQIVSHYIGFVDFLLPPPLNNPIVRKKTAGWSGIYHQRPIGCEG